jgi:hypothetical protein
MTERRLTIAMAAAVALVLARSAVFLWWEQSGFDSDQAIFGLMAKHLVEGRAFPMFIYGDSYLLAVQSWLAAPLFAIFGPSVAVLKIPVVAINAVTAALLVWILHRDGGLRPATALLASMFFVFAAPVMAKLLVETGGGNPEPFLYVLLLWVLRDRPLAFGLVFGLGFIHREFTTYGVTAIIAISLLADRRLNVERVTAVALAGVGYFLVSQTASAGFLFSSPFGPGTTIEARDVGYGNSELAGRVCFAPETIVPSMTRLFGSYLGFPFGATSERLVTFGVRSLLPPSPGFWPALGLVFAIALTRVIWISVRDRKPLWAGSAAVGTFLLLVGLQSGVVYVLTRCGRLEPDTLRYALLMLYIGVGIAALYFVYETQRTLRLAMAAVIVAWTAMTALGHARLFEEYLNREPGGPHRALATYLTDRGIKYARSDYWTAYVTTFLANEKVVVDAIDTVRITAYQKEVAAHDAEAVNVQREPCRDGTGEEAVAGTFWICRRSN